MPGQPAARIGDQIACPVPQATPAALPHAPPPGIPITAVGAPTVLIGGQPAARVGDFSLCVTPVPAPNPILRGAFPVPIMGAPAARLTDQGTHPGSLISPPCCPTVLIGLAGTSGNPWAGKDDCAAAAAGRSPPPGTTDPNGNPVPSGTTQQSYNNCGVETSRLIINRANSSNIGQEALLNQSFGQTMPAGTPLAGQPLASQVPGNLYASGGTIPETRAQILRNNGVPAHLEPRTMQNLETAVSSGRGNIVVVDSQTLWSNGVTPPSTGDHVVQVIGVEYDENGNVKNVIINDTGTGNCHQVVPANVWNQATGPAIGNWQTVVTDRPIT